MLVKEAHTRPIFADRIHFQQEPARPWVVTVDGKHGLQSQRLLCEA